MKILMSPDKNKSYLYMMAIIMFMNMLYSLIALLTSLIGSFFNISDGTCFVIFMVLGMSVSIAGWFIIHNENSD